MRWAATLMCSDVSTKELVESSPRMVSEEVTSDGLLVCRAKPAFKVGCLF